MMEIRAQSKTKTSMTPRDGHFVPPNNFYNSNPQIYSNHFTVKNVQQPQQYSQGMMVPTNVANRTPPSQDLNACARLAANSMGNQQPPILPPQAAASQRPHYHAAAHTQRHAPRGNHPNGLAVVPPPPPTRHQPTSYSRGMNHPHQMNPQAQAMAQPIPAVPVAYMQAMHFANVAAPHAPPQHRFVQPQLHSSGVLYYPGHGHRCAPNPAHIQVQAERSARISSPTRARSFRQQEQEQKEKRLASSSSSSHSSSTTCLSILCEDTLLDTTTTASDAVVVGNKNNNNNHKHNNHHPHQNHVNTNTYSPRSCSDNDKELSEKKK